MAAFEQCQFELERLNLGAKQLTNKRRGRSRQCRNPSGRIRYLHNCSISFHFTYSWNAERHGACILHDHPDPCAELRDEVAGIIVHSDTTPESCRQVHTQLLFTLDLSIRLPGGSKHWSRRAANDRRGSEPRRYGA